jgi:Reeler domain
MQAIFVTLFFLLSSVVAYPTFTGGCKASNSLGGPHLQAPTSGLLSALGLQLTIGTSTLTPGKALIVKPGTSLPISIVSTGGKTFRGFQIRISKGTIDTSKWLTTGTDTNVQVDNFCTMLKVGGICHNSKSDKSSISGILTVPTAMTGITIAVTVVLDNKPSIWYKSSYKLVAK